MSTGKCLCGSVSWEINGEPDSAYHCHCAMCRKMHGAAFGTYYFATMENFDWTGVRDSIVDYRSSTELTRSFCGTCGSVVPNSYDDERYVFVPAGNHDDGPAITAHIFVGSKAPWYEITDQLPQYQEHPPGDDAPVFDQKLSSEPAKGVVRGSCQCGVVQFHLTEPFKKIHNCHCSRCRRARSAAHTTNGFCSMDGVKFIKGEEYVTKYKFPDARYFTHAFCDICGSGMPRIDPGRKIAVVPLGSLDDDPGMTPNNNIYVADKAGWYEITDKLPAYDQDPPV